MAKTVDFVELIQGVRKRPRSGIEIYPRKCGGVVFVVVVHYFTFIFSIRGKRFSKDESTMNLFLRTEEEKGLCLRRNGLNLPLEKKNHESFYVM